MQCYMMDWTTIRILKETREKLKALGRKDETYDEIIAGLMENAKA